MMDREPAPWFLSYARSDANFALRFADALLDAGLPLWVDQYNIRPSQHWDRAVEDAVRQCAGLIVVLSPRSAASHNVADEIAVVLEAGKEVVPVMMETCVIPLRLTRVQYIDARTDTELAVRLCLKGLSGRKGRPEPQAAVEPAMAGRSGADEAVITAEVMARAEEALRPAFGAVAGVMVRKAATSASHVAALHAALARSIGNSDDCRAFLAAVAAKPVPVPGAVAATGVAGPGLEAGPMEEASFAPEVMARITRALAHHLGPISASLVKRERSRAATPRALCQALAGRIDRAGDRAAFLAEAGFADKSEG